MLENFIYSKEKTLFEEALDKGLVMNDAIVFIEDTKEIWTHGSYFCGAASKGVEPTSDDNLCTVGYVKELVQNSIIDKLNEEV